MDKYDQKERLTLQNGETGENADVRKTDATLSVDSKTKMDGERNDDDTV